MEPTPIIMPWYIPIISAIVGGCIAVFGAVVIRHFFDSRSERGVLRREIFKDYMKMKLDGMSGLLAIQRTGAIRLPRKDFDLLVSELTRCGHPPSTRKDLSHTGKLADLYDLLLFCGKNEREVNPGTDLHLVLRKFQGLDTEQTEDQKARR